MTVAVTGHRPDKLGREYSLKGPISKKLFDELSRLVDRLEPRTLITGMALGVDMLFANVAVRKGIPFIAAVPFEGQEKKWPLKSQNLYHKLLGYAKEVVIVSPGGYKPWKMQARNEWMVNRCDVLIAVWDGSKGGTFNCVEYAVDKGVDIKRINPKEL